MAKFKDSKQREWTITMDPWKCQLIRDRYQLDLADVKTPLQTWSAFRCNLPLTCMVAMTLCEDQATERNITPTDVGESLNGEAITAAFYAILAATEAWVPPECRSLLTFVAAQFKRAQANASAKLAPVMGDQRLIDALAAEQDKDIEERLANLQKLLETADTAST